MRVADGFTIEKMMDEKKMMSFLRRISSGSSFTLYLLHLLDY